MTNKRNIVLYLDVELVEKTRELHANGMGRLYYKFGDHGKIIMRIPKTIQVYIISYLY